MAILWLVLFFASSSLQLVQGLPLRTTPHIYPHDESSPSVFETWGSGGLYTALPALVLVATAVGLLFGCAWCFHIKESKPTEGTDNQIFRASATHLATDARRPQPPDSGFSEPANNNVSEDNNNGPISLREMQNIANNNAAAYIVSENEERNRISRESVVEFEPLPRIRVADPLERCADWFGESTCVSYNNNGPISLREMQNIANNNAAAYIVSENEERNRISRESVVEFEPLPRIRVADPLERCADWFGESTCVSYNNNGPISLREMQNIANNNAAAYIVSENEERNRISRESVVEFEPLPRIRVADPLERCADWFAGEDLPRNRLQYLREIGRGWFGRVVEGELEDNGTTTVAVKILNQNARLEDKAQFLDEARLYRDSSHENVLGFLAKCLQEDPWILIFEYCAMDLQQYLIKNRPKMAILNESGVPLQLMCDFTSALSYLHSRGYLYGNVWSGGVLVRGGEQSPRAVLGRYAAAPPPHDCAAPEARAHPPVYTASSEVWSAGCLLWEVCAWGAAPPPAPPPPPDLPCPYRNHLYQVMQLCWNPNPESRPTSTQVHALINHLHTTHSRASETSQDDGYGSSDFEERWQRLKPNTIPKVDEHIAIVHAPSTSMSSHFTGSDQDFDNAPTIQDTLSVDMDTAVSRSSSIMSDKDPLSIQVKSESLTNLHGSLEDVRNIYLTHNETAVLECHQGNVSLEEAREKEHDRSDGSVDPWLKDIITGSQDDVSYYKDVSDVIKNLDNILNSEKTSSSESSHQASPSRDNLSLECKKDYPVQTCMVKSPGISNFQNILDMGFNSQPEQSKPSEDDEADRDTIGTLSHSFERYSDTTSQASHTLENLTPDTPMKDLDITVARTETKNKEDNLSLSNNEEVKYAKDFSELPKEKNLDNSDSEIPKLMELRVNVSESIIQQVNVKEDCQTPCDNNKPEIRTDIKEFETKSIDDNVAGEFNTEQKSHMQQKSLQDFLAPSLDEDIIESQGNCNTENTYIVESSVEPHDEDTTAEISDLLVNKSSADNSQHETFTIDTQKEDVASLNESEQSKLAVDCTVLLLTQPKETLADETSILDETKILQNQTITIASQQNETPLPINSSVDTQIDDSYLGQTFTVSNNSQNVVSSYDDINQTFVNLELGSEDTSILDKTKILQNQTVTILSRQNETPLPINSSVDTQIDDSYLGQTFTVSNNSQNVVSSYDDINKTFVNLELGSEDSDTAVLKNCGDSKVPLLSDNASERRDSTESPLVQTINNGNSQKHLKNNSPLLENTELSYEKKSEYHSELQLTSPNKDITSNLLDETFLNERLNQGPDVDVSSVNTDAPEKVQNKIDDSSPIEIPCKATEADEYENVSNVEKRKSPLSYSPISVQTIYKDQATPSLPAEKSSMEDITNNDSEFNVNRSDIEVIKDMSDPVCKEQSSDATVCLDLNNTDSDILKDSVDSNLKDIVQTCLESSSTEDACTLINNDSTVYLDLPSVIRETDTFLHSERILSSNFLNDAICASTPKGSMPSTETTLEDSGVEHITEILSEPKKQDNGPGVVGTKSEQRCVPDSLSPFDSPTKSHHTDTYDENSSVVLGPFENCTLEIFKGIKSGCDPVDIPKEELLAFSSNFSEMNLETPSPLRDGNFLNEVPDLQFDDTNTLSEAKPAIVEPSTETNTDETEDQSTTEKRVSPSTPPNSPGNFLASVSQQKFLVDIDVSSPNEVVESVASSSRGEVDLDLQITTKLAMAENENNMNIEYSGPLTEEGLVSAEAEGAASEAAPELVLAAGGGRAIDDERMKELRNELELKLPLAQVAAIEPSCSSWCELPPPPEVVLGYGLLSPIAEETRQQLSAYENDDHWTTSTRTESSESYPEPCNNSADEVTDLPTGAGGAGHSTYTIHSREPSGNLTYTVHNKEPPSSKEITMSADSLMSPLKRQAADICKEESKSGHDRSFVKAGEVEANDSNCERISQVSPFLLSPTTDTSAPENSENVAGMSTLSKPTVPTDAKSSKPSETQCLSKATSIDSWCSNDTLYNVEENFDDLAMDPDVPIDLEQERDKSESEDTLTHNDDDKEVSHCSTYIVHDAKSEVGDTFTPESITINDNYTYTKAKTDVARATPSVNTDLNDSTKNTTQDLAYGTFMSGMPSFSNCTTEVMSGYEDAWKLAQPELVRTPRAIVDIFPVSLPKQGDEENVLTFDSPQLKAGHSIKRLDSVDVTCLRDESYVNNDVVEELLAHIEDSPEDHCHIEHKATSTPLNVPLNDEDVQAIPMHIPTLTTENSELSHDTPNSQGVMKLTEIREQNSPSAISDDSNLLLLDRSFVAGNRNITGLSEESHSESHDSPNLQNFIRHEADIRTQISSSVISENTSFITPEIQVDNLVTCSRNFTGLAEGNQSELSHGTPNSQSFMKLAEIRAQNSSSATSENSNLLVADRSLVEGKKITGLEASPTYSEFEASADTKSQDVLSSCLSSEDFRLFESSVRHRPQDLSSLIDASSLLLKSERISSDFAMCSFMNATDSAAQAENNVNSDSVAPLVLIPPNISNLSESHNVNINRPINVFVTDLDYDDESEQPHSIIITESQMIPSNSSMSPNGTYNSHTNNSRSNIRWSMESQNRTYESHLDNTEKSEPQSPISNGIDKIESRNEPVLEKESPSPKNCDTPSKCGTSAESVDVSIKSPPNIELVSDVKESQCNGKSEKFATVQFLNEAFEELLESNVDDNDSKDMEVKDEQAIESGMSHELFESTDRSSDDTSKHSEHVETVSTNECVTETVHSDNVQSASNGHAEAEVTSVTQNFLLNEKKFCGFDAYLPLLSDIRFTGPASEIMTTSFTQDSPTEPTSPECEQDSKPDTVTDILKEWDSDSESHSSNSSSGEFIWKGGDGQETALVPSTQFQHQRDSGSAPSHSHESGGAGDGGSGGSSAGSGDSASGSEGDEVEFVPSSWDCRAAPAKSSLRSLEQPPDSKKRVVFKRQKYHCVYEYPREACDVGAGSPAPYLPDFSTYCEWDPSSAEEAELGYGQLFGAPSPLDMYPLRGGIAFGADYDEDFFISSSARPFESVGVMSGGSQFFPGLRKPPPSPHSPPPAPRAPPTPATPSLDLTTPDSGVEDVTPGSLADDHYKPANDAIWRPADSTSSSESVSPSSPASESLGGLRHTRDRLKLDLPPSPRVPPSPRHNRVFNFVLEKPKRNCELTPAPLVMTDETPVVTVTLPVEKDCDDVMPEPTFSTFGKGVAKATSQPEEQNIILTDESVEAEEGEIKEENLKEPVKGEGTLLDSGDEDSGIESSSKATLERAKPAHDVA